MSNNTPIEGPAPASAIGVFDSGIGGLSVLRHVRAHLPYEDLIYVADSGYAPYGDKSEAEIAARALAIASFLLERGAKALVVACNTATAAAINALRARYPELPLVGVEPGLKPAAALSHSKTVGVLATDSTLASARFALLREQISAASGVRFLLQPCSGLAGQVDKGELQSRETALLVERYVAPLIAQGADTLVLGCTHYPFVLPLIEQAARSSSAPVTIIDTGEAVARQLKRVLAERGLERPAGAPGTLAAFTSGSHTALATAFANLLGLNPPVATIVEDGSQRIAS
jgi:glutamate racemase